MAKKREVVARMLPKHELGDDVWTLAVQRARRLFEEFDHVAVQFSGGKDSTATLHAVLAAAHEKPEERLPVRVIFFDEEVIPMETEEYVRRVSQRDDVDLEWYCIPLKHFNTCSREEGFWYPWAPEAKDKWVRSMPPEALTDIPDEYYPGGYAGVHDVNKRVHHSDISADLFNPAIHGEAVQALGIRAAESLRRMQAVTRREKDNWIIQSRDGNVRGALWRAYPVYDWGNDDVWTAPKTFGWDYNHGYDTLEMRNVPIPQQRMGPPFGAEAISGLKYWQEVSPDIWSKVVENNRIPGAATAARYASTVLYSAGEYPTKPEGITWMDFIMQILDRHRPDNRVAFGERVFKDIDFHRRRSDGAPMAEHAPHPESGASWDFLAMLASRGDPQYRKDMKNRRAAPYHKEEYAKKVKKYEDEIEQIRKDGRMKEIL